MTTPAGGIEPDLYERIAQVASFLVGFGDAAELGAKRLREILRDIEERASTATASPQSKALVAAVRSLLRTACPSSPGLASVSLDALNDVSALLPPLEHLTERSALQPEAPCEDLANSRRYRWLRDLAPAYFVRWLADQTPDLWDAAIDAAMKERL